MIQTKENNIVNLLFEMSIKLTFFLQMLRLSVVETT